MKRRQVLSLAGGVGLAALAGCLGNAGAGGDDPDEDDTATPTSGPEVTDSSFSVTSAGPDASGEEASVTFDDRVRIEGTVKGNNGCYTAELADTTVADGELVVTVEAFEDREDDQMCTQALIGIEYEATVQVDGELPERVVVKHDVGGEVQTVAEVDR